MDRPVLNKLLDKLDKNDTLIVTNPLAFAKFEKSMVIEKTK